MSSSEGLKAEIRVLSYLLLFIFIGHQHSTRPPSSRSLHNSKHELPDRQSISPTPQYNMANPPHPRFSSDPKLDYILLHTGLKVAETLSLAVPPAYLIFHAIRGKRPFSVNRFLGATWMTSLGGAALSMPVAYYKLKDEPEVAMQNRMERLVSGL